MTGIAANKRNLLAAGPPVIALLAVAESQAHAWLEGISTLVGVFHTDVGQTLAAMAANIGEGLIGITKVLVALMHF